MIPDVANSADELNDLCRRFRVSRLELFGSAANGQYRPAESDLDFVVDFQVEAPAEGYADAYFGLLEALEQLFGRLVDMVVRSAIRNPYFLQSVEETRTSIYRLETS